MHLFIGTQKNRLYSSLDFLMIAFDSCKGLEILTTYLY